MSGEYDILEDPDLADWINGDAREMSQAMEEPPEDGNQITEKEVDLLKEAIERNEEDIPIKKANPVKVTPRSGDYKAGVTLLYRLNRYHPNVYVGSDRQLYRFPRMRGFTGSGSELGNTCYPNSRGRIINLSKRRLRY
ncbi:hypothetical protein J4443_02015 [Candidatus Woesearchaeota archaeon]|nr:hypothetical protein [Candidatus Woesearchaeota archaeon]